MDTVEGQVGLTCNDYLCGLLLAEIKLAEIQHNVVAYSCNCVRLGGKLVAVNALVVGSVYLTELLVGLLEYKALNVVAVIGLHYKGVHTLEHLIELEGVGDIGEPLGRFMVAELAYHLTALTGYSVIEAYFYGCGAVCENGNCYGVAAYAAEVNVLEAEPAVFICKACSSLDTVADIVGLNGVKSAKHKLVGVKGSCAQTLARKLHCGKDMVLVGAVLAERSQEELAVALAAHCYLAVFNGNYLGNVGLDAQHRCDAELNIICIG